jgi:hypothetical protein
VSLLSFVEWLGDTPLSVGIRESTYSFPIIESVHVLGLCLFLGFTVLLDLRLLGLMLRRVAVSEVATRLLPWTWTGFLIMIVSGVLTFFNDPVRYYNNIFFRIKVAMLVLAGLNAWLFHSGIYRSVSQWDRDEPTPARARITGYVSLALWASIVVAGRMIAYNWFDKK